ncbi:MAG: hypothetical protein Q9209_005692 [Squamulea sp. 1 TL-2023]
MDDLSGLSWTSSGPEKPKALSVNQGPSYPTLRPTPPISGRSSPFPTSQQAKVPASGIARSNASTPANDSFANLVSFNAANGHKGLSLQEQQRRLQEERAKLQRDGSASRSGQQDEDFWEKLGSGTSTPNLTSLPLYNAPASYGSYTVSKTINGSFTRMDTRPKQPTQSPTNDNNLPSGFGAAASDSEIEAPKITMEVNTRRPDSILKQAVSSNNEHKDNVVDYDDPFGLGPMTKNLQPLGKGPNETLSTEEDILGLLGGPASEFLHKPPQPPTPHTADKGDQALADLIDMGFDMGRSRQALARTETGVDVQSAVGWLLNEAHQASTQRSQATERSTERSQSRQARATSSCNQNPAIESPKPAWMRDPPRGGFQHRQSSRSPVNGENPSKLAAEIGNNLFKTANSIWKTGAKKLNQAVAELNLEGDSSQPKWMRERELRADKAKSSSHTAADGAVADRGIEVDRRGIEGAGGLGSSGSATEVTDEALMLESTEARPPPRNVSRPKTDIDSNSPNRQPSSSSLEQDLPRPRFLQQHVQPEAQNARGRLSKQIVEEQAAEAYISPARRKKTAPKPSVSEPDLLFGASEVPPKPSIVPVASMPSPQPSPQRLAAALPEPAKASPRPSPPKSKRCIPSISLFALRSSHNSRQAGTAAFKRGGYSEAVTHYSSALAPLPPTHPLSIPILTNRALSHLKIGDAKNCIVDSDTALEIIGSTRGVGEVVDLDDEDTKDMFTYWGKAMTRRAEALEQLERWADAGDTWRSCVEASVGGATSIAGRNRCEKVIKGNFQNSNSAISKTATIKRPPGRPKPKTSALHDLSGNPSFTSHPAGSVEAVTRLRAANLETERLDDEKFALSDKVSERVTKWRSGKEGNLRALLASLDTVLWEGSGWKKVSMGELILAGKVKVVYMKGIGKVHPDKLPTTATTEQRMISAAVFAILNQAWDGFKRENGL